ncbi:Vta1 like-domain-containing protein [Kockovaella imperatae]|uniref:Vta1 like-domain-containing protein n=1 Tax=Kockovaella imperatae TaxID=4999 RepID=A0A1Y1UM30_9TREE|nr:Vta1 like-domain-containing protein [Kockovaella imperatae]ORX39103.1 Vta1 like-domain-containing protein [Kockovaella imperatae]
MTPIKRPLSIPTPPSSPEPGRPGSKSFNGFLPPSIPRKTRRSQRGFPLFIVMDNINLPSESVPPELRVGCEQILKRAKELKKAEPIVAYWCCFSAAQKALKIPNRSAEGTKFLLNLLDCLEEMKALLDSNDAIITEAAGAAYVENFALKVFMSADNDDRNGVTGKATIRKFVVAGQFIEVLRCFENGMTEEMEQKLQYARWKAADGAKALREGREPASGPPIPDLDMNPLPSIPSGSPESGPSTVKDSPPLVAAPDSSLAPSTTHPRDSPSESRPKLPDIDTGSNNLRTPRRDHSSGSGAWSTVATPGLAEENEHEKMFPAASAPPPGLASPPRSPATGERKNVRFMGPDGAPLSPAQTYFSVDSVAHPTAPPPTTIEDSPSLPSVNLPPATSRPRGDSGASNNSIPRSMAPIDGARGNGQNGNASVKRASPKHSPHLNPIDTPPPPPPSLASISPTAPQPAVSHNNGPSGGSGGGLGLAPGPPASSAPVSLTRKQVDQVQKHAKWAISALDYDDYETAKEQLKKALAMLGP